MPRDRVEILSGRISEKSGNTYPLELSVECPFHYRIVGERLLDARRKFLPGGEIDDFNRASVDGITEQENLEIFRFAVTVHTAFRQVNRGKGFYING